MFRRGDSRSIEYAITHRVGAGGTAERCLRPAAIREVAERVQRWAVTSEACRSCQGAPALRLTEGLALCPRCHAHRAERLGRAPWSTTGIAPHVQRAEDAPPPPDRELHGYAIRFNEKSVELWGFFEFIRPSAADRMEAEKPDIRALWNHDDSEPIGRYSAGTLRAVKRSVGVWTEIEPPRWASRYVETVERRDVTGMSFGFIALEDDWWLEDGIPHREILDMEIVEFSPVAFPAYPTTSVKVVDAAAGRAARWRERQSAERLRLVG